MRQDYTDITLVVDRSGSMETIKDAAQGGINTLIKDQKAQPGKATFTLVQFDGQNPYEVIHNAVDLKKVEANYVLTPRGSTPLYGCVGQAILETGTRLAAMKEEDRPALVLFIVATDGENTDRNEFSQQQVADMIKHQREVYKWDFTYIGANQDAVEVAKQMSIPVGKAATYSNKNTSSAYSNISGKMSSMRKMVASGTSVDAASVANSFSLADRNELVDSNQNSMTGLGLSIGGAPPQLSSVPTVKSSN